MGRYGLVVAPFAILYFIYTQGWVADILWWILSPLAVHIINQRIAYSASSIEAKAARIVIAIMPTICIISVYTLFISGPFSWMVFLPFITIVSFSSYKGLTFKPYIVSRWRYANKDGNKDHRRKDNELIERLVEPGETSFYSESALRPVVYQSIPLFLILLALKSNVTEPIERNTQALSQIIRADKTCNLRKSPSSKSNIIGSFKRGSEAQVLNTNGNWIEIEINNAIGFVHNSCGSIQ